MSENKFRIVLMGDSSSDNSEAMNTDMLNKLFASIKALVPQPELIFFLGDMVDGGSEVSKELKAWKALVQKYYNINMIYPLLGNHEHDENIFSDEFSYLPNEQLKGYKRTVYYFDYKNARFIVLNSDRTDSDGRYVIKEEQRIWLENILAESKSKYNFVMLHVPAFPTGHHYGEALDANEKERDEFWKIIDRYNVTAVFAGHEHNYCRRVVDKSLYDDNDIMLKNSIYHIVSGGAGSSLDTHMSDIRNVKIGPLRVYHYVVLDIDDDKASLQAYDYENYLIDSCNIMPNKSDNLPDMKDENIIPMSSKWRYLDNGTDQGTAWRELYFSDYDWSAGLAELGYGDGGEATVVSYGPNIHKKYITTYFRKSFVILKASSYDSLTGRIQRDDGAVVYLNGREVYRSNMPSDTINYKTLALKSLDGDDEKSYESFEINVSSLKDGYNILAVEIHQAKASSSDISFNFQLIGHKKS